jgi:hypothetical protein
MLLRKGAPATGHGLDFMRLAAVSRTNGPPDEGGCSCGSDLVQHYCSSETKIA